MTTVAPEFLTLTEAASANDVSLPTIRRRLAARGITVFQDPRDIRRRLVRRADLESLFGPPVPEPPSTNKTVCSRRITG